MQLTAIGLNHQTAPLSIRERLAFAAAMLPDALRALVGSRTAEEAVILSTCNRTELYCVGEPDDIVRWLADYRKIPGSALEPYLYRYQTEAAVRHAFRVSCGLDSMVLGEPQILGQIKDAVRVAQEQQAVASNLHALFQKTFAIAKEVRTSTAVGANSVSMAAASVKMAGQIFPDIGELNILFVGAGEMIELVATHFAAKSPRGIMVANRTLSRAQELCAKLASPAAPCLLSDLPQRLHEFDVVVSSTASQLPIIGKGMVERALRGRRRQPVFLLDLAVPRDIEAEVAELDDAYLYTVDDMMQVVNSGLAARQQAAAEAEQMVESKVEEFMSWQRRRQSVPLIRSLRDEGERARQQVLENTLKLLAKGVPPEEALARLSVQLTNKLLHAPTRALSKVDGQTAHLTEALVQVYGLDKPRA
ncbi:glutamyl-tRNA reductase [Eikenella sp. Marseille-P7795]|uniref:glutamyl-tRNA reductase n=1 Tax=Eikenella sp. Marseille-P7795 TaxID=2866577 RepID=UPI001CE3F4C0|nr:glutamyl-tRNA reductase [Eikenella sp. Marseille-P7795]